jgi:prepilin-type N-terminal cleavage/methylation domain-containing protein
MKKQTGFTLVELIITVTIMALLMAAAIVSYTSTAAKSRDARRVSDMEVIRSALEICRSQDGAYPNTIDDTIACPVSFLVTLKKTPVDPQGGSYDYNRATTTTYTLTCTLENTDNCKGDVGEDNSCTYTEP